MKKSVGIRVVAVYVHVMTFPVQTKRTQTLWLHLNVDNFSVKSLRSSQIL